MSYKEFKRLMDAFKSIQSKSHALYNAGIELLPRLDFMEDAENMLKSVIKSNYGEKGWDWVSWYVWDNQWGKTDWSGPIHKLDKETNQMVYSHKDGNPTCYNLKTLYETINQSN